MENAIGQYNMGFLEFFRIQRCCSLINWDKKKSLDKILINVLQCAKNATSQLMQCHITKNSIEFMQWSNFMKGIVCLYVHKGTAGTLQVISKTMYILNQQSQFWNRLVRTNTAAPKPVRAEAALLNNLWINQRVPSYLGKQKGRSHSRTRWWGTYISGP